MRSVPGIPCVPANNTVHVREQCTDCGLHFVHLLCLSNAHTVHSSGCHWSAGSSRHILLDIDSCKEELFGAPAAPSDTTCSIHTPVAGWFWADSSTSLYRACGDLKSSQIRGCFTAYKSCLQQPLLTLPRRALTSGSRLGRGLSSDRSQGRSGHARKRMSPQHTARHLTAQVHPALTAAFWHHDGRPPK